MPKNYIFILAHQDDEFALFNILEKKIKEKKNIKIYYLTSGYKKKINKNNITKRDKESLKILIKLGIRKKNIFFIGRKLNIPIYMLYKNLWRVFDDLKSKLKKKKFVIITHAWEGGNEDHDSCFVLVKKLFFKNKNITNCYQFSQYHNYKTGFLPFIVQKHFKRQKTIHVKINLKQKIRYIKYLFAYSSQKYLWLPIYPFVILRILLNNYGKLIKIEKNIILKKPHKGLLLYEKLRETKYQKLNVKFREFLYK